MHSEELPLPMAKAHYISQVDVVVYSGVKGSMEDGIPNEGSEEEWLFDQEIVLEKMLYVARRMSAKELEVLKHLLSLATRARS
jgi:hypothetical protein